MVANEEEPVVELEECAILTVSQISRELEQIRSKRVGAEKKVGEYRALESKKRTEADKIATIILKTSSESTRRRKQAERERHLSEAQSAGKKAIEWQKKVNSYSQKENTLQQRLSKAQSEEMSKVEKQRQREYQKEISNLRATQSKLNSRINDAEQQVGFIMRAFPKPKQEKLRVLVLTSNPYGDLRVDREQKRIKQAVQNATHRDWIEMQFRPAATLDDLFDGLASFSPHIVHFTGHSNESLILLEQDKDEKNDGFPVWVGALKHALLATDKPPQVVVLNSCESAAQLTDLVGPEIPFAVGMLDEIGDSDAINFAARFYATIANGQSLNSAVESAKAYLLAGGFPDADLPVLVCAPDSDPRKLILVEAPVAANIA